MQTSVSESGQVTIPGAIRKELGLQPGDELDADVQNGTIVLAPRRKDGAVQKARIVEDPVSGLPVIDVGDDVPVLTSQKVRDLLSDFP